MVFEITWIGQGGYIINIDHTVICIDPYLSDEVEKQEGLKRLQPAPFLPEELKANYIVFTHDHLDHFDEPTIQRITNAIIQYVGPTSCAKRMKRIAEKPVMILNRQETMDIGPVTLRAVYTKHTDDSIGLLIQKKGQCRGGIYLTGDTEYDPKLTEVKAYAPELMIGCINGKLGNMDYEELAQLAQEIGVKTVVPSHYGMFEENTEDPQKLAALVENSDLTYLELEYNQKTRIALWG